MIVFNNHLQPRCGVYQMGLRIGQELARAIPDLHYVEGGAEQSRWGIDHFRPDIVVHNWHPFTMPWSAEIIRRAPSARHVGLIHELPPLFGGAEIFPFWMICDPTFQADNKKTFRCVRQIPRHTRAEQQNDVLTIGSFGFAVGGKLFHDIVTLISSTFSQARIRLHISAAHYGDDDGSMARAYARDCAIRAGSHIELVTDHEFLGEDDLVSWLAKNDLNVFFYQKHQNHGISSVIDYAIAAQRPIAVNDSYMFRHVQGRLGHYPINDFSTLLQNGPAVETIYQEWSPERLVADWSAMFAVLRQKNPRSPAPAPRVAPRVVARPLPGWSQRSKRRFR